MLMFPIFRGQEGVRIQTENVNETMDKQEACAVVVEGSFQAWKTMRRRLTGTVCHGHRGTLPP